MKKTYSIGERLFRDDFGRRKKMFDALVGNVALYGAEIWGWKNDARLNRITRKYIKWILGLDWRTPTYILVEETKMIELRLQAMRRAITYEEKTRKSEKKLVVECIKNLEKERRIGEESKWEAARRILMEGIGMGKEKTNREIEEGNQEIIQTVLERIWRKEKEERQKKIGESRYNNRYREIIKENPPKYLQGKRKRKDRYLIARYRCGNELKGNQHWRETEDHAEYVGMKKKT